MAASNSPLACEPSLLGRGGHFLSSQKGASSPGFTLPTSHEENDKTGCGEGACPWFPKVAGKVFPSLFACLLTLSRSQYFCKACYLWVLRAAATHMKKERLSTALKGGLVRGESVGPGGCLTLKHTAYALVFSVVKSKRCAVENTLWALHLHQSILKIIQ